MNFEQATIPPIHVIDPQAVSTITPPQDLEEGQPSQEEELTDVSELSTIAKVMHCFTIITKPIYFICGGLHWLFIKTKRFIYNNRIITFVALELLFIFLHICKIIAVKALFWLTSVPIFIVLLFVIVHLCITAQRSTRQLQREQQVVRSAPRRPPFDLNERIMEHILLNSQPNRLDLFITGTGGQMRLMHLEPDIDNLQGTRMQIRLISQGLLRLLAEFIEEQQQAQHRNQRNGLSEEQITSLPVEKYLIPLTGAEEETCSICIDEFKQEQDLRKLPCNHRFHLRCVDEWLKLSNSCPNCKSEVVFGQGNAAEAQAEGGARESV